MKYYIETKKKKYVFTLSLNSFEDSKECQGFTNKCKDGQYITLLDYDHWMLSDVKANIIYLQDKWGIKFRYIIETEKGYHAISLDKVPFNYLREILDDSLCDRSFAKVPFITTLRSSTLRLSKKNLYPEMILQYPFGQSAFEQSNGHYQLLKLAYRGALKPEGEFDNTTIKDVEVNTYWSKP